MTLANEISFESVGKIAGIVILVVILSLGVGTWIIEKVWGPRKPKDD